MVILQRTATLRAIPKLFHSKYCTTATVASTTTTTTTADSLQWQPIYRFNFIRAIAGLNKLKIYQAALTSVAVPTAVALESVHVLSAGNAEIAGAIGN